MELWGGCGVLGLERAKCLRKKGAGALFLELEGEHRSYSWREKLLLWAGAALGACHVRHSEAPGSQNLSLSGGLKLCTVLFSHESAA